MTIPTHNLDLIRNTQVDILHFKLLTLGKESQSLSSLLNERLKPKGGTRKRGRGGDSISKKDNDMRTETKSYTHTPLKWILPSRRVSFLHCDNVNQNENENLCASNWICTDEGHFIGLEEQTNSQNED